MESPIGYIDLIVRRYLEAKKNRISRFDIKWGKWSAAMNRLLQVKMKDEKEVNRVALQYVFIYWSIMSNLLGLHFKSKFLRNIQKKRLFKEACDIKGIALTGDLAKPMSDDDLKKMILSGILK